MLKRSVAAYCAQTHTNKELIVVTDGPLDAERSIAEHIGSLGRSDIRIVHEDQRRSLGALRNLSCEAATGAYLCQWDDDDIYHPRRLEAQYHALVEARAECLYLEDTFQFIAASRQLYWMSWRATEARAHPGTLLCRRASQPRYPESGEAAERGEDRLVCLELQKKPGFATLSQSPYLYVYVTHGVNKFPPEHHAMLSHELAISRGLLVRRQDEIRAELTCLDFGSGAIVVQGSNGPAFVVNESASS